MTDRAPDAEPPSGNPESAPDPVPCRVCREEIRRGASKCVHCDSYQDWRSWLGSGGRIAIVLSLLSTLIAVASALLPPLLDRTFPDSDLEIVRFDPTPTGITFVVQNSGNRDGLLSRAALHLGRQAGRACSEEVEEASTADLDGATASSPLFPPPHRASRIVPAGGIAELEFELRDPGFFDVYGDLAAQGDACEVVAHLEAHLREFSGDETPRTWSFDARRVFDLMDR